MYVDLQKSAYENDFFWCENKFKDNNAKSYSLCRNRVSEKIDYKAVGRLTAMPTVWKLSYRYTVYFV